MKYAVFALTCLALAPVAVWCAMSRRAFALLAAALLLPALAFQPTSLNPISFEDYRGTARGYEISLIVLLALTILLALRLRGRRIAFAPDWGAKLYLLYFGWSCLSLVNADSLLFGGAEALKMAVMLVVFAATYSWLCAVEDPKPLLLGLAVVVIGSFLSVAHQHLSGVWQVRGPFPHQNSLALYMMMAAPVFFAYYLDAGWRAPAKWLFGAAFFLGSGCLVRTYSRGAIACYPVALLVVLALSLRHRFHVRQLVRLVPLAVLAMCALLLILPRVVARFEHAPKSSGETRVELARVAANMIRDRPALGVGLNNWGLKVNPPYTYWVGTGRRKGGLANNPDFKDGIVETVYLLVGAECGLPGLALLLAWHAYYLLSCLRLARRLAGTSWFFLPAGLAGGLVGTYLQSTLEWVLKQSVNFSEMMILFAVVSFLNVHWKELRDAETRPAPSSDTGPEPGPSPRPKPAAALRRLELGPAHD